MKRGGSEREGAVEGRGKGTGGAVSGEGERDVAGRGGVAGDVISASPLYSSLMEVGDRLSAPRGGKARGFGRSATSSGGGTARRSRSTRRRTSLSLPSRSRVASPAAAPRRATAQRRAHSGSVLSAAVAAPCCCGVDDGVAGRSVSSCSECSGHVAAWHFSWGCTVQACRVLRLLTSSGGLP